MRFTILGYEKELKNNKLKYATRIFVEANNTEQALEVAKNIIEKKCYIITDIDATINAQIEIASALKKHLSE